MEEAISLSTPAVQPLARPYFSALIEVSFGRKFEPALGGGAMRGSVVSVPGLALPCCSAGDVDGLLISDKKPIAVECGSLKNWRSVLALLMVASTEIAPR